MLITLLISVCICSFIGWLTNFLAIKMLFHPHTPKKILGFKLHGIFPKRQKALAVNLATVIEEELFSYQDIQSAIQNPEFSLRIKQKLRENFKHFLSFRLSEALPMAAMFLTPEILDKILKLLDSEMERIVPDLIEVTSQEMGTSLDLKKMIQEKIEKLSIPKLEELLMSIMSKEFRFVEIVGAVLGGSIGLLQSVIFLL